MATGKYAKAISDRSGLEFPYNEMVREWNGSLVHTSEFEHKHPQLELSAHPGDVQGLTNARPDRVENAVATILKPNPFETIAASSGIINVSEQSHGRSTGDTVRFRGSPSTAGTVTLFVPDVKLPVDVFLSASKGISLKILYCAFKIIFSMTESDNTVLSTSV